MEPAYSLKRDRSVEYDMCIICQENKSDKLLYSEKGLLSLKDAAQSRQTFIDPKNRLSIDRIMTAVDRNMGSSLHWHKLCYALFTSKSHIARLAKSKQDTASSSKDILEQSTSTTPRTSRRSMGPAISWECCMFCQNADSGEKLSSVSTFNKSNEILESSKYDPVLRVRLADVNDLMASEGKYHLSCFVNFDRRTKKARGQTYKVDLPMQWLMVELKESAQKAHVLELSEVWKRYCALCDIAESDIPQSFQSRRATFREKLEPHVENYYDFISIRNKQTLLVPLKFERSAIYKLVTDDQDETPPISVYKSIDDDFLEMVHVALKLRSDIFSHPLYQGFIISEDEMISSVPESLFMFIRLLFGGQKLLESDPDNEQCEMQERESKTQSKVLSIAQDLVYNVTGGKHWTPKHLGLASTLHQATRSKDLVQLFHNAGHTLSYDNVLQVDTALAEKTLNTLDPQSGAVIPPNFNSGKFVHFTCDNIDINDSSFDGKDSFHATQVAAWQRGPESDMGFKSLKPSTNTSLQVPEIMEEIFPSEISEGKTE